MSQPTIIIAEAGVNHNGDIELAKKLIEEAAKAGADYVKFQTWITEDIVDINAPKADYQKINDGEQASQYEMLKKLELSFEDFRKLKAHCELCNIKFLSTPDDYKSLDFLVDDLKIPLIKIGSGEINNIPYLRRVGMKKCEVILSTGMASIGEVEKAYFTLLENGATTVALLHCTSNYPAPYESVNLKAMLTLQTAFNTTIGYSDHTLGNEISLAAVALGAKIIEKHFTLDTNLPGPDHKASITGLELKNLVMQIRNVEKAMAGTGVKTPHQTELETKKVVTKGMYLTQEIPVGTILTDNLIALKRPAGDLDASFYDLIIGKKVNKTLIQGSRLSLKDIDFGNS